MNHLKPLWHTVTVVDGCKLLSQCAWVSVDRQMHPDSGTGESISSQVDSETRSGIGRISGINGTGEIGLTGRSALPERTEWEPWLAAGHDDISDKIRRLLALEAMRCRGHGLQCGCGRSGTNATGDQPGHIERFGAIHGMIHGAGNTAPDAFPAVNQTEPTTVEQHFRPKAQGLLVLEELCRGKELDFCLLLSSLSAVLGGLGLLAYSAANIFLDAFASQQNQAESVPWISVNWDAWKFPAQEALRGSMDDFILPQEGMEAFARILDRVPLGRSSSRPRIASQTRSVDQPRVFRQMQQSRGYQVATLHAQTKSEQSIRSANEPRRNKLSLSSGKKSWVWRPSASMIISSNWGDTPSSPFS